MQGPLGVFLADYAEALIDLMTGSDPGKAKRAFEAMMTMKKIDLASIEAAANTV